MEESVSIKSSERARCKGKDDGRDDGREEGERE